ncbi:hypothetical protein PNA2_1255 [Pyrococcus sp. NA2]|uniref:hypothetical protein n=1 Tax=Pyrococcus sp. (strain NA2) TaxID=342949 RepID=UPI000209ACC5|nr:hypothetical protein [Pyrococcus sp. NA2]AEC52170.1 hypothetical protein PNA2_1255 [Pyrococcus sp. NA2]
MEEDLTNCLKLIKARLEFAEKLYGFSVNYVPLVIEDNDIIVFDKRNEKIKWLSTKSPLSREELGNVLPKIRENIKKGLIDLLITLNFEEISGPEH